MLLHPVWTGQGQTLGQDKAGRQQGQTLGQDKAGRQQGQTLVTTGTLV